MSLWDSWKRLQKIRKILGTFKYLHWLFPMLCLDCESYNLGVIFLVLLIQTLYLEELHWCQHCLPNIWSLPVQHPLPHAFKQLYMFHTVFLIKNLWLLLTSILPKFALNRFSSKTYNVAATFFRFSEGKEAELILWLFSCSNYLLLSLYTTLFKETQ